MYLSKKLFVDASSAARPSQKLSVQKIGPFTVLEVINKNVVRLDLPDNIKIHTVIHVEHTARAIEQLSDISNPAPEPARPFINEHGEQVIQVDKILSHRRRGRRWQFLTLFTNAPLHEAEWKTLGDFVDADSTITEALHVYIKSVGILHHLH